MRKLLAAALAVLMLCGVFAAFPASAAGSTPVKTIDGTTASDYNNADLVVTEVMVNSRSNSDEYNDIPDGSSVTTFYSYDCFDYIEIYNKGDEAINLYDYCLLRADRTNYEWGRFDSKTSISPNTVVSSGWYSSVMNPSETEYNASNPTSEQLHWLRPGEFAVIWCWNDDCNIVAHSNDYLAYPDDLNHTSNENAYYFPAFREFYNVPDDTIVLAVDAYYDEWHDEDYDYSATFDLDAGGNYMYAIAENDFDCSYELAWWNDGQPNDRIECLFAWGVGTKAGILSSDNMDGYATNYLPATASPDVYNAEKAQYGNYDASANYDFVQTGHSLSYKEMAIFRYALEPTVGSMPLYQWACVDPEGLMEKWGTDTIRNYVSDYDKVMAYKIEGTDQPLLVGEDGDLLTDVVSGEYVWVSRLIERTTQEMAWILPEVPAREEELIEINLVRREDIENMYFGGYNDPPVQSIEIVELDGAHDGLLVGAITVFGTVAAIATAVYLSFIKYGKAEE